MSRSVCVSALSAVLVLVWVRQGQAAGEGCTERDLEKATVAPTEEARIASIERWLGKCEGHLTNDELADGLASLLRHYMSAPPNYEGCLRVTTRLIQLGEVRNYVQYNDDYGYCGGDCTKSPRPRDCQEGRDRRNKERAFEKYLDTTAKVGAEFQMDQPVPCAPSAARKLLANMDKAAFYALALRFLAKYEKQCPQAGNPAVRISMANDKALIFFHRGDDAACLRALDEVAPLAKGADATAFNRALCGGPCALDSGRCAKVQEVRKRALLARARLHPSGTALDDPVCARGKYTRVPTHVFAWDLKSYRVCQEGKCSPRRLPMTALGDLNGDGWGEYSNRAIEVQGWWNAVGDRHLVFRLFSNVDVCGMGDFVEVAALSTGDTKEQDHPPDPLAYTAKVTAPAHAATKSYCIYPSKGLKCSATACNVEPYLCADMTRECE
jgi:hypothetical protein